MGTPCCGLFQIGPSERRIAIAVRAQMIQFFQSFVQRRVMPGRHPPHHEMHFAQNLEPFGAAVVELLVQGAKDKGVQAGQVLPNGQVRHEPGIAADLGFGIACVRGPRPFHHPNKARHPFAQPVDAVDIAHEIMHPRIIGISQKPSDVQFCEVVVFHVATQPQP
mgnify:CR=1 FL=1